MPHFTTKQGALFYCYAIAKNLGHERGITKASG